MLWNFSRVYNAKRQYNDHQQPVQYVMRLFAAAPARVSAKEALFVNRIGNVRTAKERVSNN